MVSWRPEASFNKRADKSRVKPGHVCVPNSSSINSVAPPQPAYSYYPDDEFQHFYRWTSPPGILKIMSIIVVVLSVAIFACVASTLAWDSQGALGGFGGLGYGTPYGGSNTYGSFGGGGYGAGNNYGYGNLGGNYNDPRSGKGFMIAMAAIAFIFALAVFIIVVSRQSLAEGRKFYLAVLIIAAFLALLMLIASIVYLMAVNPMAQSYGSVYGSQIAGLCAQYQGPQVSGVYVNQYLYHYCVVEPQEVTTLLLAPVTCPWQQLTGVLLISGHRCGVWLPGRRGSHHHARLLPEDSPEDWQLRQEQHFVEEGEGHRRDGAAPRCGGVGESRCTSVI